MCLAVPARVVEVIDTDWAVFESGGVKRKVGTRLVGEVSPGEYLIIHAGFALEKLDTQEAEERIRLWEELMGFEDTGKAE